MTQVFCVPRCGSINAHRTNTCFQRCFEHSVHTTHLFCDSHPQHCALCSFLFCAEDCIVIKTIVVPSSHSAADVSRIVALLRPTSSRDNDGSREHAAGLMPFHSGLSLAPPAPSQLGGLTRMTPPTGYEPNLNHIFGFGNCCLT